jgi:TonB family protein
MAILNKPFFLVLFFATLAPLTAGQIKDVNTPGVGYSGENLARGLAVKKVMPVYPDEAVSKGLAGIVEVRVGVDEQGVVRKIKVPPNLNPLFRQVVVDAVKQWQFEAARSPWVSMRYMSNRLTFEFVIEDGRGLVRLYNPPWDSEAGQRLRECGSPFERREWADWEDALKDDGNTN